MNNVHETHPDQANSFLAEREREVRTLFHQIQAD